MFDLHDLPHVADVSMNIDKLKSFGVKIKSVDECLEEILRTSKQSCFYS